MRREPLVALLPENHPRAAAASVTLPQLAGTPFILFESGFSLHRILREASRRAGFEPDIAARTSQIDFMLELVAAGLGVAFLPRMIADSRRLASVRVVTLDEPGTEWRMTMAWRRGGYLSAAARAWLDLLGEEKETRVL